MVVLEDSHTEGGTLYSAQSAVGPRDLSTVSLILDLSTVTGCAEDSLSPIFVYLI